MIISCFSTNVFSFFLHVMIGIIKMIVTGNPNVENNRQSKRGVVFLRIDRRAVDVASTSKLDPVVATRSTKVLVFTSSVKGVVDIRVALAGWQRRTAVRGFSALAFFIFLVCVFLFAAFSTQLSKTAHAQSKPKTHLRVDVAGLSHSSHSHLAQSIPAENER